MARIWHVVMSWYWQWFLTETSLACHDRMELFIHSYDFYIYVCIFLALQSVLVTIDRSFGVLTAEGMTVGLCGRILTHKSYFWHSFPSRSCLVLVSFQTCGGSTPRSPVYWHYYYHTLHCLNTLRNNWSTWYFNFMFDHLTHKVIKKFGWKYEAYFQ